jgi:hypothetical protein
VLVGKPGDSVKAEPAHVVAADAKVVGVRVHHREQLSCADEGRARSFICAPSGATSHRAPTPLFGFPPGIHGPEMRPRQQYFQLLQAIL